MGFRTFLLFGFFSALVTAAGILLGYLSGLRGGMVTFGISFLVFSLVIDLAVHRYSASAIMKRYGAKPCKSKKIEKIVEKTAVNMRVSPAPEVHVLPIDVPNAFSCGEPGKSAVCLTEGMLDLNEGEIESVVSHEMWHIKNKDTLLQNSTSFLSHILCKSVILVPFAVLLIKTAMAQEREFRADYYGYRFSKKPNDTESALKKVNEVALHNPMEGSKAFECIWFVNPFERKGLAGIFSTHPPTARRYMRIKQMHHEGIPEPFEPFEPMEV